MKKLLYIALVLYSCASFSSYAGEIKGAGAGSCGEWVEERKSNSYFATLHWIQGFISAYNLYVYSGKNPDGVFGNADHKAIAVWMDNYCHENPLSSPAEGTVQLIKELKSRSD
jgi:hypothetical protein